MKRKKNEKSKLSDTDFPKGLWPIYIEEDNQNFFQIGSLRFDQDPEETTQYFGAMQFLDDPKFKNISGKSYSVQVFVGPKPGTIIFQILDAATEYDENTGPLYQFIFVGFYEEGKLQYGTAKVPSDFGLSGKGDEGDTVRWTSEPVEDPHCETSK
jgi:hypothetical protein